MDASDFLCVVGLNAICYCVYLHLNEIYEQRHRRGHLDILSHFFFLFSLPFVFVFEGSRDFASRRTDELAAKREEKLRFIARTWCKPARYEIEKYDLDCEGFERSDGEFDLRAWREHELSRTR